MGYDLTPLVSYLHAGRRSSGGEAGTTSNTRSRTQGDPTPAPAEAPPPCVVPDTSPQTMSEHVSLGHSPGVKEVWNFAEVLGG